MQFHLPFIRPRPFVKIPKENVNPHPVLTDKSIAALFLEAVADNPETARGFVSKNYVNSIDLESLRDALGNDANPLWVVKAPYADSPKNCLTRSVMMVDGERNIKGLLHLHMIREPDKYGPWKIYMVEQE